MKDTEKEWQGDDLKQHYAMMKIEPLDYIISNKIDFCEGNVIKYVSRHQSKNGADDIKKAIHYLRIILQTRYNE